MNLDKLETIFNKQPAYRLKQAKLAIFHNLIDDWEQAKVFSPELRKKLNQECPISINAEIFNSKDTDKILLTLKDGLKVESVLMRHSDGRNTVCVSSQVGCSLGCKFCATGKIGFKRNLNYLEIVEQVLFFSRYLKKERVSNIVFMGMGEPFLNYDNAMEAIKILNDKDGLNIGVRNISISTVGITEGIEKLSNNKMQINLAISLHAPTNELRSQLVPENKNYPIEKILNSVDEYIKKTKRKVMFEYLLIKDINDSDDCARQLAKIMKKPLFFVNLITYNHTGGEFKPSLLERIRKFKDILDKEGVAFSQRYRFGREIKAGCGQLAAKED